MQQITFHDLDNLDVALVNLSAYASGWPDGSLTRYTGDGRPDNMLFYLNHGCWQYRLQDRDHLIAHDGDILFIPSGCCYEAYCRMPEPGARSSGICLKFILRDETGIEIAIGDTPQLLTRDTASQFQPLFEQALQAILRGVGGKILAKSIVFRLLDEVAVSRSREDFAAGEYRQIYPAVHQIELHPGQNLSIGELAEICFLSESTFRRKFRQYAGMSPLAYRNAIRVRKAGELLASGLYTVEAAAAVLGFTDASHYYKACRRLLLGPAQGSSD
jgi:AraC-like DNA-binding protein